MVLLAEDEKGMGESLKVLQEWFVDWSLRVNGSKCGVIHFRRKGEERSKASFNVGQEAIRMVQEYKYSMVHRKPYDNYVCRLTLSPICLGLSVKIFG